MSRDQQTSKKSMYDLIVFSCCCVWDVNANLYKSERSFTIDVTIGQERKLELSRWDFSDVTWQNVFLFWRQCPPLVGRSFISFQRLGLFSPMLELCIDKCCVCWVLQRSRVFRFRLKNSKILIYQLNVFVGFLIFWKIVFSENYFPLATLTLV